MDSLSNKTYQNNFVAGFPGEQEVNLSPRQTPGVFYSRVLPSPVREPRLLAWSDELAKELEVNKPEVKDIEILAGNLVTASMQPYSACYGGHQFGNWAGPLGEG